MFILTCVNFKGLLPTSEVLNITIQSFVVPVLLWFFWIFILISGYIHKCCRLYSEERTVIHDVSQLGQSTVISEDKQSHAL